MGKFSKNRKYLFERISPITPNSTKLTPLNQNGINIKKLNWMQNLIKIGKESKVDENFQNLPQTSDNRSDVKSDVKCCVINHISEFSESDKNFILNYFSNISKNHNRANDYLKGLVVPKPIKSKRISKSSVKKTKITYF
jgi:hypothetical protein